MSDKEIAADAARLKRHFAQRAADDAKLAQRERAKREERHDYSNRPRPKTEQVDEWTERRRQAVTAPGNAAEFIARLGGLESMLSLSRTVYASRCWPGGHQGEVCPDTIEWLMLQSPFVEAFGAELDAYLPADPPDVLPKAERDAKLAAIDAELAEIAAQRQAIANELDALSFTPKEAAA